MHAQTKRIKNESLKYGKLIGAYTENLIVVSKKS